MDWGTLWKSRTSNNITVEEWRRGKDHAHETHIAYIPSIRSSTRAYVSYEEHVLHFICEKPDTKVVASNLNRKQVCEYIQKTAHERDMEVRVKIDISDGPFNQYRCKDAFGVDKQMAVHYNWSNLKSYSVRGWGKAKVDLYGAKVPYLIRTILVPLLKERSVNLDILCSTANELCGSPMHDSGKSNFKLRMWIHVPKTSTEGAYESRSQWKPLKTADGEYVVSLLSSYIFKNSLFVELAQCYCFYLSSDPNDPFVYARRRTCRFCTSCVKSKFLECCNVDRCGQWYKLALLEVGQTLSDFNLERKKRIRKEVNSVYFLNIRK